MADARRGRVFISYRRQDSAWPARQLYDALAARFGAHNVFKDVDDIDPGEDFVDIITEAVARCDVLLALIGPQWTTMTDAQGRRRLDDPQDFVRIEIAAALRRGVRVIPILIDTAVMPAAAELPDDLAPMVRRQAVTIDPVSFNTDRLFSTLAAIFDVPAPERSDGGPAASAPVPPAPTDGDRASAADLPWVPDRSSANDRQDELPPVGSHLAAEIVVGSFTAPATSAAGPAPTPTPTSGVPGKGPAGTVARVAATVSPSGGGTPSRPRLLAVAAAVIAVAVVAALAVLQPWRGNPGGVSAVGSPSPTSSGSSAGGQDSPRPTGGGSGGAYPPGGPNAVWAHRGGLERHQFSTLPALESAAMQCFSVELDVRHTSDGVAVLVHDEDAQKGLDCGGADVQVSKVSWRKLSSTCRSKPTAGDATSYPVARFGAAMEAIAAASPSAWVFPELKDDLSAAQLQSILATVVDIGLRDRVVITSFSRQRLARVRAADPDMPTLLLVMTRRIAAGELKADKLWGVAVEKSIATKQYVDQLQANDSRVIVWTVNDEKQWEWARTLGVDTVMTDYPAKYAAWAATQ